MIDPQTIKQDIINTAISWSKGDTAMLAQVMRNKYPFYPPDTTVVNVTLRDSNKFELVDKGSTIHNLSFYLKELHVHR